MKAILLEQPGQLRLIKRPDPGLPGKDEVLVRVHQVGVCGTDLHAYQGNQPFFTYPRLPGHELSVEVLAVGPNEQGIAVGDRCALEPYFHCGHCPACLRGKPNCCLHIQVFGVHIDGGMRERAIVPTRYLHPSTSLPYEELALVEPLAIGAHAVTRAQLVPGEQVLVVGAGPIGLAVLQFALLAGARVIVADVSEQRLRFCQSLWPQVVCLDGKPGLLDQLRELLGDDLPTVVFDATGNPASMHASFTYPGNGGKLVFVGLFPGEITFHDPDFHRRELTLLSSRNALSVDFQNVITALEAGQIDLRSWMTHRATPETISEAFPHWFERESGMIKALVSFA